MRDYHDNAFIQHEAPELGPGYGAPEREARAAKRATKKRGASKKTKRASKKTKRAAKKTKR